MTRKPLIRALPEQDVALLEKLLRQRKTYDQIARHLRCSVSRVDLPPGEVRNSSLASDEDRALDNGAPRITV